MQQRQLLLHQQQQQYHKIFPELTHRYVYHQLQIPIFLGKFTFYSFFKNFRKFEAYILLNYCSLHYRESSHVDSIKIFYNN